MMTLPEWQCRPHSADYIWRGPSNLRIWKEVDPVSREITAFHAEWLRSIDRPVYLDGRAHPPDYAAHTWAGFSTGKWDGDVLTVTVTHLKEGYVRRNGLARSDHGHADRTLDPPWRLAHGCRDRERSRLSCRAVHPQTDYELDLHQQIPPYPCEVVNEVPRPKGTVPNLLPGANYFSYRVRRTLRSSLRSHARRPGNHVPGIPEEAERGQCETGQRQPVGPGARPLACRVFTLSGYPRRRPGKPGRPHTSGPQEHLHAGRRGRKHRRFSRSGWRPAGRFRAARQ